MGKRNRPAESAETPALGLGQLWPIWGVLAACVWVAFAPGLGNGFVDWDDRTWIVENPAFRGLGPEPIRFAFTTFTGGVYQPLGWLLQSLTYEFWGLDPRGYHRVSLGFHILNTILLHLLCVRLVARGKVAGRLVGWLCAVPVALHAVHPLRVEVVAWASCQAYLPGVTFSLLATLAYLRAHPPGQTSRRGMIGSSLLVVLAVLSKGSAVVLPVVFLILDAYPLRRLGTRAEIRRALIEKIPLLMVCLVFAVVAFAAKRTRVEPEETAGPWIVARGAQAGFGAFFYLAKTAWPSGIAAFYPRPEGGEFRTPLFAACAAGVAFAVLGAVWQRRRRPWWLAALAAYLAIASPYLGLARVGITLAADRYSYAPTMAWVVLACAGLCRLGQGGGVRRRALIGSGALVAIGGLMTLCSAQCRVWGSSERLWGQALAQAPWSSELHRLAGASLADEGTLDRAIVELREALRLRPDSFEAAYDLGVALDRRGEADEAIAALRDARRLRPEDARTRFSLGVSLLRRHEIDEAVGELTRAVELRPGHAEAHAMLGSAAVLRNRQGEAVAHYREALRLDPDPSSSRIGLGLALARLGRPDEAVSELREAARRDRRNPEVHHVLGAVLAHLGKSDEAAEEFAEALRLRPDHARARASLEQIKARRL